MKGQTVLAFFLASLLGLYAGRFLIREHTGFSRRYNQVLHYYSFLGLNSFAEPLDFPYVHGGVCTTNRVKVENDLIYIPFLITSYPSFSSSPTLKNGSILSYLKGLEGELRQADYKRRKMTHERILATLNSEEQYPGEMLLDLLVSFSDDGD